MQVVKSELPHTSLRDKSVMVHWSVANACNFVVTFTLPYLIQPGYANLGARVGLVYGCISLVFLVLVFLYVPEMTNRSLEEIDEMIEARVPAWRTRGEFVLCPSSSSSPSHFPVSRPRQPSLSCFFLCFSSPLLLTISVSRCFLILFYFPLIKGKEISADMDCRVEGDRAGLCPHPSGQRQQSRPRGKDSIRVGCCIGCREKDQRGEPFQSVTFPIYRLQLVKSE